MRLKVAPLLLVVASMAFVLNCRGYHYFMDMYISPAVDSQQRDTIGNRDGNLLPPENTVAYKAKPYFLTNQLEDYKKSESLANPIRKNDTMIPLRGKHKYNIYCAPCHGDGGLGDGPVKSKFQAIPAIVGTANAPSIADNFPVGRIYHVITVGKGLMYPYASQILERDRWYIANYVKYLQNKK